ncbi:MAG TPA: hypothetical protein VGF95_03485 [Solirubrobacteraceae bacterium]|jgi:hypothetical protein
MSSNGKSLAAARSASATEIADEIAWEGNRRTRLAVPAVAGGVLYLLSGIIISSTLSPAPTVGLLQALKPGISEGIAEQSVSPRTREVTFVSHHAFALIAGSALSSISLIALTAVLLLLVRATRFRRPESWAPTAKLVLVGGIGFAVVGIGHQIAEAILTHEFAVGGNHSSAAVERALTSGTTNVVSEYISLLAGLSLAAGMIVTSLGAMRVGLIARWMGVVGVIAALLIFLPIGGAELEIIPAFWLVAMGILLMGRWPAGDPPAWAAGEARPWPTQAEMRARQQAATSTAGASNIDGLAPAPEPGRTSSGGRRRRKHGSHR